MFALTLFSQNSHNDKFSKQFNQAKIFRVNNKLYLTYILNKLNENIHKYAKYKKAR